MRPPIIGLHGKARVGKDTVAQFIVSKYSGYRYGFSDPIKAMLGAGLGIHMADQHWVLHKEDVIPALGKSPRQLMQTLGTEWGRNMIHRDLWLTLARDQLNRRGRGMVISDMRFENEAAWVRNLGGIIIHIVRGTAPPVSGHVSEVGIERAPADRVLLNNSTFEDLRSDTFELLDEIMGA